jgi:ribulose 1,5-bisphosphate carboxylase large subunit-like protein
MQALRFVSTLFLIALCADTIRAKTCFDDENLAQRMPVQAKQRPLLLYVWSPRMVYSVQNITLASQAAAAEGMDIVLLHDSRVPDQERREVWQTSAALCAQQLIHRDALRHFPTAFVVTSRGIHAQPIVGAMPLSAWQLSIAQRLKP